MTRGWLQTSVGFFVLVFGVFLTSGLAELLLAVGGVYVASRGLEKLRRG
jgi:hypothetical protein